MGIKLQVYILSRYLQGLVLFSFSGLAGSSSNPGVVEGYGVTPYTKMHM
jgi:hypothetical protein